MPHGSPLSAPHTAPRWALRLPQRRKRRLARLVARPILIAAVARPDGRLALTYSVRPGRRITMIAGFEVLTPELAEEIAATVIPMIDTYSRADRPAG
jgi:hypothetical protein